MRSTKAAPRRLLFTILVSVCLVISACGGGGGGTDTAGAPSASKIDAAAAVPAAAAPAASVAPTTAAAPASGIASNEETVGRQRALSADFTLAVTGVNEVPPTGPGPVAASGGRQFYVDSRVGDDRNDGTAPTVTVVGVGPWKTLARVMQSSLGSGDALVLACGSQWNETLRLPASGTATRPVLVTAPREGCTTAPAVDGSITLAPTQWVQHSGNIYKAALDAPPLQLFSALGVTNEAHHPNRGYLASDPASVYLPLGADGNSIDSNGRAVSTSITVGNDLTLPAGAAITAGTRIRLRTNSWTIDETRVAGVAGNTLTLADATSFRATAGWGYFLVGQLWMLDSAGEWYYDTTGRTLYAWMPDSKPPAFGVTVSTLATGVDLTGRGQVTLAGIAVRRVGTGIALRAAQGIVLQRMTIEDTSEFGIDAAGSTNLTVQSSAIARTGTDAISGGFAAVGMRVLDNVIRDSGVQVQGEQIVSLPRRNAAAVNAGPNALVRGNTIVNAAYIGIRLRKDNVVEGNLVFGACTVTDDCGGIYTVGFANGSVIRENTVLSPRGNVSGKSSTARLSEAQGIFLDESASGVLVEENTVIGADNGIQLHVASSNTIRANRLLANRHAQLRMVATRNRENVAGDVVDNLIEGNQIAPVSAGSLGILLETAYSSISAFGRFDANRFDDRLQPYAVAVFKPGSRQLFTLAQWKAATAPDLPLVRDPTGQSIRLQAGARFTVSGTNLVTNGDLQLNSAGWTSWNQTAPAGTLARQVCDQGYCLRYTAGGSPGVITSPSFSVQQGQWYRLTVDVATEREAQTVALFVRRGGGGINGYESLSDRPLTLVTGRAWRRYSIVFQATKTVNRLDPVTGDHGARVDIERIEAESSISLARMELVPLTLQAEVLVSAALLNAGPTTHFAACPLATSAASLCPDLRRLDNDQAVAWPATLPGRSALILYARPAALLDSDGDGVADSQDTCPGTLAGEAVNALGCALAQR